MILKLCSVLLVLGLAQASRDAYFKATGRWMMAKKDMKVCAPAKWNFNNNTQQILYQMGEYEVSISQDGTFTRSMNKTTKEISCDRDLDTTFTSYTNAGKKMAKMGGKVKNKIALLEFIKPFQMTLNMTHTFVETNSYTKDVNAVAWSSKEQGWVGLDWFFNQMKHKFVSRLWWNSYSNDTAPTTNELSMTECGTKKPDNYESPKENCDDFYAQPESTYSMERKAFKSFGARHHTMEKGKEGWFSQDAKFYNDPSKKLMTMVVGDTNQQHDKKKMAYAMWVNATGTYMMDGGQVGCIWDPKFNYDMAVKAYSTPTMTWIGKAKVKKFYPKNAQGTTVNLYQGVLPMGKGYPITTLVDENGLYRGDVVYYGKWKVPARLYFDRVEESTPTVKEQLPHKLCVGHEFFTGAPMEDLGFFDMNGAEKASMTLFSTVFLLCCSLFMRFF